MPKGDPLLILHELDRHVVVVSINESDWRSQATHTLAATGIVRITAPTDRHVELQIALLSLITHPVEVGFLRLYPYVARLDSTGEGHIATLHLREAIQ